MNSFFLQGSEECKNIVIIRSGFCLKDSSSLAGKLMGNDHRWSLRRQIVVGWSGDWRGKREKRRVHKPKTSAGSLRWDWSLAQMGSEESHFQKEKEREQCDRQLELHDVFWVIREDWPSENWAPQLTVVDKGPLRSWVTLQEPLNVSSWTTHHFHFFVQITFNLMNQRWLCLLGFDKKPSERKKGGSCFNSNCFPFLGD